MTSSAITCTERAFGVTAAGEPVRLWCLDDGELAISVLNLGGIVQSLLVPDAAGRRADVVLGFDDVAGYERDTGFLGALIGRFAGRLTGGRFSLEGQEYRCATNEGGNTLHGGPDGFHRRLWAVAERPGPEGPGLRLSLTSPDGDQGFPGTLQVTVDYRLLPGRRLMIEYAARTDRATVVNLTQHSYVNLAGVLGPSAPSLEGHRLQVEAGHYLPVNPQGLPSGEIGHVVGTSFDLRSAQPLDFLSFDHTLVLDDPQRLAAVLDHPASGRRLEVRTSEPGLQVYTGDQLDGTEIGKSGVRYPAAAGICLESQHFPDAPNRPRFPSTSLRPGEEFRSQTEWRFG